MKSTIELTLVLGMVLTTCQSNPTFVDTSPLSSPQPADTFDGTLSTPQIALTHSSTQEIAVQASRNDLSWRLNINADQITVVNVTEVTWSDTSLGCPQPGMVYAQVLTPGYMIQLKANERIYAYQSDTKGNVAECGGPEFPVTPGEIQDGQPWMPVP